MSEVAVPPRETARALASPAPAGGRGTPLGRLLALLTLALALPLVALAGVSAWSATQRERARFEDQLVQTTRALALGVDREWRVATAILDALAALPSLAEGDLPALDAAARQIAGERFVAVLFDAAGATRMNTALPRDESVLAGIRQTNPALVARTLAESGPLLSEVFVGASGRHVVAATRRVEMAGAPQVLAVTKWAESLGGVLREQGLAEPWVAAVLDADGRIVARTRAAPELVGTPAMPGVVELLARADEGLIRGIRTRDGMLSVAAASRAPGSRFSVVLAAPEPSTWAGLWQVLAVPGLVGLGFLAVGLLAARHLGARLVRGIARLAPGGAEGPPSGVRELDAAALRLRAAERARDAAARALADSEERFRVASEAFAGGVYECRPPETAGDGAGRVIRSQGLLRVVGEERDAPTREWWMSRVHPDDRAGLLAAYASVKVPGGRPSFEAEYRARHRDGRFRWVWHRSVAARRDAAGRATRLIGSLVDITAEREAREAEAMVSRELDHRVKNTFALVGSIAGLTAGRHPEAAGYVAEFRERLAALAAAHDVLRRGAEEAALHALLRRLAEPYGPGRVAVSGQDAALAAEAVPQLALILHEWLTNAAKHGALSAEAGRVAVATERDSGSLVLRWAETGGPPVAGPPAERGFGSMLAEATAGNRFGGALEEEWHPAGLRLTLRLAAEHAIAAYPGRETAEAGTGTAGPATLSR